MNFAILDLRKNRILVNCKQYNLYDFSPLYDISGNASLDFLKLYYSCEDELLGEWLHLGVFYHLERIEKRLHELDISEVRIKGCSRFSFFPMWAFLSERNLNLFKSVTGSGKLLGAYLAYRNLRVQYEYSILSDLKVIFSRSVSLLISIAVTARVLFYAIGTRKIYLDTNEVLIARGKAHINYNRNLESQLPIVLLDGWFRSTKVADNEELIRVDHILSVRDCIKILHELLKHMNTLRLKRFAAWLPMLQLKLFGANVNKILSYNNIQTVHSCEVLYPFNRYISQLVKISLHISSVFPDIQCDIDLKIYDNIYVYDKQLLAWKNLQGYRDKVVLQKFKIDELRKHNGRGQTVIFFTQPVNLENEKLIIEELAIYCRKKNLKLKLQLHPRSNKSDYKLFTDNIIEDWRQYTNIRFGATRNSSIGLEVARSGIPMIYFVTDENVGKPVYSLSKRDLLVDDLSDLENVIAQY